MINIRPGVREDIPALLEIYNYEVLNGTATLDIHPKTLREWEKWFDDHGKENHPLLVAVTAKDGASQGSAAPDGVSQCSMSQYGAAPQAAGTRTGAGRIAGYATLSPYRAKEAYAATVELSVYISPACRRQGVATRLMEEILKFAREDENTHLVVSVITSGNKASEALHDKFGFTFAGNIPEAGVKFGEYLGIDNYYLIV